MTNEKQSPAFEQHRRLLRRIVWIFLIIVIALVAFLVARHMLRYRLYNVYRDYLPEQSTFEQGSAFAPLEDADAKVAGMELAAENDVLKLYANPASGEVAVYDKRSGEIIRSNPENVDADKKANGTNKNYLKSQLVVDYYNASRVAGTYASQNMCVDRGQLEVQSIEDGVRFIYGLGEIPVIEFYVPTYLTAEWFNRICENVEESDAKTLDRMADDSADG